MGAYDVTDILAKPISQQLLTEQPLARFAYVAKDGTPRVFPTGFWWADPYLDIWTIPWSAKVAALGVNPAVAITIDVDGMPPRALFIRGTAELTEVDGVPDDYVRASMKTQSAQAADDFRAQVSQLYDSMTRIRITPTWAKLIDFETTAPSAVEEAVRRKTGG